MLDAHAPVPSRLPHSLFVATPLTTEVAALDYASYMASPEVIRVHSDGRWPVDGFTLSDDLELVAQHQADHESHRGFTFVLLAPSQTEALGCLYLNPLREYLQHAGAAPELLDAHSVGVGDGHLLASSRPAGHGVSRGGRWCGERLAP